MSGGDPRGRASPPAGERRVRIIAEVPESLASALHFHAANGRTSRREIIESALQAWFHPSREAIRDTATSTSLRRTENRLRALIETNRVLVETIAVMVQLYLGTSPEPVTPEERRVFNDKLSRRWPRFVQLLTEVLEGRSKGLYSHIPKEMIATAADFPDAPAEAPEKERAES